MLFRKLINNLSLIVVIFMMLLACNGDETPLLSKPVTHADSQNTFTILDEAPECLLQAGSSDWDGITLTVGQSRTFAIENIPGAIYKWTRSGRGITITSSDDANTVTITAAITGTSTLYVTRDLNDGGTCGRMGTITVVKDGGGTPGPGPTCACPAPVIKDELCVTGGHPYWRFSLSGVSTSDVIYWYGNHITVTSGQGGTYVVANPDGTGDFTLYCRVTRRCSNGVTSQRIGYYTNSLYAQCGTGRIGFQGTCGAPID